MQGQLSSHMGRRSFDGGRGRSVTVAIRIDGGGRVQGVSLIGSSGDANLDNQVIRHLNGRQSVAARPDGQPDTLSLRLQVGR